MSIEEKLQRVRIRGVFSMADGEIRPFDCDLTTILRAIETAAAVGVRVKLDEDHVKVLQGHLESGAQGTARPTIAPENGS